MAEALMLMEAGNDAGSLEPAKFEVVLEAEEGEKAPAFVAGDEVRGQVRLVLDFELPVRGVSVALLGHERAFATTGADARYGGEYVQVRDVVAERAQLAGRSPHGLREVAAEFVAGLRGGEEAERRLYTMLEPGTHVWPFSFRLPEGAPPSYAGRYGSEIAYRVEAAADVPFSRDLAAACPVAVLEPRPLPPTHAVSVESHKEFLFDDKPLDVRVRVPSNAAFLGSVVSGITVAVRNRSHHRVRSLRVALWRRECVRPEGNEFESTAEVCSHTMPFAVAPGSDAERRVSFAVPSNCYPSIDSAVLIRVEHFLRFTVDIPWAVDLSLDAPLTLLEHPDHAETTPAAGAAAGLRSAL